MEVETGEKTDKTNAYPEVRSRYNELTRGIREETSSSSSYKSGHRVSPPRKTKKLYLAKEPLNGFSPFIMCTIEKILFLFIQDLMKIIQ